VKLRRYDSLIFKSCLELSTFEESCGYAYGYAIWLRVVLPNVLRAGRARTHQLYSVLVFSSPENVAVFPSPRTCYVNEVDVGVAYAIT